MQPMDIFSITELTLKIIFPIVCIIGGTLLIFKGSKAEESGQKYFFIGMGVFGYLFALTRFSFIVSDFTASDPFLSPLFWRLASVTSIIALLILVLILETYIVKTKYGFTLTAAVGTVLTIILEEDLARIVVAITAGIILLVILGIYSYVAKKSQGAPRMKAIKCALSIFILVAGVFIDGSFGETLLGFDTGILGTILMIFGFSLYFTINYRD